MGRLLTALPKEEDIVSSDVKASAAKADTDQRTVSKIYDKSASTNSITFAAIDPKRADGKMYELDYEALDANGEIITKGSATTVAWN